MPDAAILRSIAISRSITGLRPVFRGSLVTRGQPRRPRTDRFVASVASRAGLGTHVARQALGFNTWLRTPSGRRIGTPPALPLLLRRRLVVRRDAGPLHQTWKWPTARPGPWAGAASLVPESDIVGAPTAGDRTVDPFPALLNAGDWLDGDDGDLGLAGPTPPPASRADERAAPPSPAAVLLARHAEFLGLPLLPAESGSAEGADDRLIPDPPAPWPGGLAAPPMPRPVPIVGGRAVWQVPFAGGRGAWSAPLPLASAAVARRLTTAAGTGAHPQRPAAWPAAAWFSAATSPPTWAGPDAATTSVEAASAAVTPIQPDRAAPDAPPRGGVPPLAHDAASWPTWRAAAPAGLAALRRIGVLDEPVTVQTVLAELVATKHGAMFAPTLGHAPATAGDALLSPPRADRRGGHLARLTDVVTAAPGRPPLSFAAIAMPLSGILARLTGRGSAGRAPAAGHPWGQSAWPASTLLTAAPWSPQPSGSPAELTWPISTAGSPDAITWLPAQGEPSAAAGWFDTGEPRTTHPDSAQRLGAANATSAGLALSTGSGGFATPDEDARPLFAARRLWERFIAGELPVHAAIARSAAAAVTIRDRHSPARFEPAPFRTPLLRLLPLPALADQFGPGDIATGSAPAAALTYRRIVRRGSPFAAEPAGSRAMRIAPFAAPLAGLPPISTLPAPAPATMARRLPAVAGPGGGASGASAAAGVGPGASASSTPMADAPWAVSGPLPVSLPSFVAERLAHSVGWAGTDAGPRLLAPSFTEDRLAPAAWAGRLMGFETTAQMVAAGETAAMPGAGAAVGRFDLPTVRRRVAFGEALVAAAGTGRGASAWASPANLVFPTAAAPGAAPTAAGRPPFPTLPAGSWIDPTSPIKAGTDPLARLFAAPRSAAFGGALGATMPLGVARRWLSPALGGQHRQRSQTAGRHDRPGSLAAADTDDRRRSLVTGTPAGPPSPAIDRPAGDPSPLAAAPASGWQRFAMMDVPGWQPVLSRRALRQDRGGADGTASPRFAAQPASRASWFPTGALTGLPVGSAPGAWAPPSMGLPTAGVRPSLARFAPFPLAPPIAPPRGLPVFRSALVDQAEPGESHRVEAAAAMAASSGQPLPPLVRRSMEHVFGMDLAAVRLHTGPAATRATGLVAARAMAQGTDIYLPGGVGDSSRAPELPLLAHELTHVVQHLGHRPPARPTAPLTLARRASTQEHEADQIERTVSDLVMRRTAPAGAPPAELTLARKPAPVMIMRDETVPAAPAAASGPPAVGTLAAGGHEEQKSGADKADAAKEMAEKVFALLEHRIVTERERGGYRW